MNRFLHDLIEFANTYPLVYEKEYFNQLHLGCVS